MHDYFRGNPDGKQPLRVPRASASRSRPSTATATRASPSSTSSASKRSGCSRRSACSTRNCSKHDVEAVTLTFTAFNRWLDEDWGFDYRDRIFAAPYISLADLDWAIARARVGDRPRRARVVMRPAAPRTADGQMPVSDPAFDPFWARVQEAGITVVVHAGDSGYSSQRLRARRVRGRRSAAAGAGRRRSSRSRIERAAYDFLITLVFDKLFDRFPERARRVGRERLRVPPRPVQEAALDRPQDARLLRRGPGRDRSGATCGSTRSGRTTSTRSSSCMGADRVIFGSDWPHIEGMPQPLDYAAELKEFDDDDAAQDPARQRARAEHAPPALT